MFLHSAWLSRKDSRFWIAMSWLHALGFTCRSTANLGARYFAACQRMTLILSGFESSFFSFLFFFFWFFFFVQCISNSMFTWLHRTEWMSAFIWFPLSLHLNSLNVEHGADLFILISSHAELEWALMRRDVQPRRESEMTQKAWENERKVFPNNSSDLQSTYGASDEKMIAELEMIVMKHMVEL